jgi:hypothetical protein
VVAKSDRQARNIQPTAITAAELAAIGFAEPEWIIQDVLPVGVHILAGKPKKGKSWLALGACTSIATGAKDVREGTSPYLASEDNQRRLQKRLRKVLDGRPAPERTYVETSWPRLHEGGAKLLDDWLTRHRRKPREPVRREEAGLAGFEPATHGPGNRCSIP